MQLDWGSSLGKEGGGLLHATGRILRNSKGHPLSLLAFIPPLNEVGCLGLVSKTGFPPS